MDSTITATITKEQLYGPMKRKIEKVGGKSNKTRTHFQLKIWEHLMQSHIKGKVSVKVIRSTLTHVNGALDWQQASLKISKPSGKTSFSSFSHQFHIPSPFSITVTFPRSQQYPSKHLHIHRGFHSTQPPIFCKRFSMSKKCLNGQ